MPNKNATRRRLLSGVIVQTGVPENVRATPLAAWVDVDNVDIYAVS